MNFFGWNFIEGALVQASLGLNRFFFAIRVKLIEFTWSLIARNRVFILWQLQPENGIFHSFLILVNLEVSSLEIIVLRKNVESMSLDFLHLFDAIWRCFLEIDTQSSFSSSSLVVWLLSNKFRWEVQFWRLYLYWVVVVLAWAKVETGFSFTITLIWTFVSPRYPLKLVIESYLFLGRWEELIKQLLLNENHPHLNLYIVEKDASPLHFYIFWRFFKILLTHLILARFCNRRHIDIEEMSFLTELYLKMDIFKKAHVKLFFVGGGVLDLWLYFEGFAHEIIPVKEHVAELRNRKNSTFVFH